MDADQQPEVIKPASFTPREEDTGRRRVRARPVQILLATVLSLFAISLWFLFTARSVLFTFDPAYSELEIDEPLVSFDEQEAVDDFFAEFGDEFELRVDLSFGRYNFDTVFSNV